MYAFEGANEGSLGTNVTAQTTTTNTKKKSPSQGLPRSPTPRTVLDETESESLATSIQFRFSSDSCEWEDGTTRRKNSNTMKKQKKRKTTTSMGHPSWEEEDRHKSLREILLEFLVKWILEVMGGTGAIWGFSEACGLRKEDNLWFWRPAALSVGLVFALRWCGQVRRTVGPLRLPLRRENLPRVNTAPMNVSSPLCSPHDLRRSYSTPTHGIELQASRTFDTDEEEEHQPRRRLCLSSSEEDDHPGLVATSSPNDLYLDVENPQTEATALTTAMAVPIQHDGPVRIPTLSPVRRTKTR